MSITETLFLPLVSADAARPLITHYDDADGSRIELSRATVANWAAKTANFCVDELDVEPGDRIAVVLPPHWQTVGVLLGAWWCGATVVDDPNGARAAFVGSGAATTSGDGAESVAIVGLDPMGMGLREEPGGGALDYLAEVRMHGDGYRPLAPSGDETLALAGGFGELTVADTVADARRRAKELGMGDADHVLSTMDWSSRSGMTDGLLAVLAAGASLVQCTNLDAAKLAGRKETERITVTL